MPPGVLDFGEQLSYPDKWKNWLEPPDLASLCDSRELSNSAYFQ